MLVLRMLFAELEAAEKNFQRDSRTIDLPLVGAPWPMVGILAVYLGFVLKWGPKLMAKRKPLDLKLPMQIYNIMQVALNLYVFYGSFRYSYFQRYFKLSCQEYNVLDNRPSLMRLRYPSYVYYISKYLDLFDTIFFVLRKKNNQITFLHVYHHTMMVYGVWVYNTLLFGSHYTATGVLNSFIHVVMYTYYFVSALKLKIDLTPWKKRLTQMQIIQFCLLTMHFGRPLLSNWCGLDLFWTWLVFLQNLFMLLLFLDFYYKAYVRPRRAISTGSVKDS